MKILFVCKWNRFRSRTAEAYFKKINKNKKITAESAGIFIGSYPLDKIQIKVAKEFGININGMPRAISAKLLNKTDLIVITADDVSESLFTPKLQRVIKWNIPDVEKAGEEKKDRKIMKKIFKKIDRLNNELQNNGAKIKWKQ